MVRLLLQSHTHNGAIAARYAEGAIAASVAQEFFQSHNGAIAA